MTSPLLNISLTAHFVEQSYQRVLRNSCTHSGEAFA